MDEFRPQSFSEFVGQEEAVERLRMKVESTKKSGRLLSHLLLLGNAGSGKAQPLNSMILTPSGYIRMGDIQIGDYVIGSDGQPKQVLGVYPQGKKPIYCMKFSDGSVVECCEEHLWKTFTVADRVFGFDGSIKTLQQIKHSIVYKGRHLHTIPMVKPIIFNKKDVLPVPSYILGLILGDGGITQPATIRFTTSDQDIVNSIQKECDIYSLVLHKIGKSKYDYQIVKNKRSPKNNLFIDALRDLKLMGCNSKEKFIPDIYLYASPEDRLAILQGLLDTDGYCSESAVSYCTSSDKLIKGVRFIVESLGGTIKTCISKKKYKEEYRLYNYAYINLPINIMPFRLKRKLDKYLTQNRQNPSRYITSVEYVEDKESQCIYVDSDDHLYVTDHCVLTHNTSLANIIANEMQKKIKIIMGPRIDKFEQILSHLERLDHGDILFIDEIHALQKKIQEQLYDVMEQFRVETFTGRGRNAYPVTIDLPRFTLIGATTHTGRLNPPLLRRFEGGLIQLQPYTVEQLHHMSKNVCERIFDKELDDNIAWRIARLSNKNVSVAQKLVKSYMEVVEIMPTSSCNDIFDKTLKLESICPFLGLNFISRKYLSILCRKLYEPMGLATLASAMREQVETLQDIIEPCLLDDVDIEGECGPLIEITKRGRMITWLGQIYIEMCRDLQAKEGWFVNERF